MPETTRNETKHIRVHLPKRLYTALRIEAAARDMSLAEVIREALNNHTKPASHSGGHSGDRLTAGRMEAAS